MQRPVTTMTNAIRLVVFDLDGTLIDSLPDLTASVNRVFSLMGLPQKSALQVRQAIGNGVNILFARLLEGYCQDVIDSALSMFAPYYGAHCLDNTVPYLGISELLQQLHCNGIKVGVYSNKIDNAVKGICSAMFEGLVDVAVGMADKSDTKPNPWGLLEIMKLCNASASQTVFVGDSIVDIDTAKNGGVKCISVSYGYDDRQILSQNNDIVVDSVDQLQNTILDM